ncbi:MAG TPA: hypothetical protein VGL81_01250 [Polyangiaceae bacterium]
MPTPTTINVSTQRATFAALLAALMAGINTELPGVDPFDVDGVPVTRADLLARIQAALDAITAVKAARTALQSAVATQVAALADARALRSAVKTTAQGKLGKKNPALQKLGFTPSRTPVTSSATMAQAQVKKAATRKAKEPAPPPVVTTPVVAATPKS